MAALTWTLVFLTLKKVYLSLKSKFIYKSASFVEVFCLIFNRVLKPVFECPFAHPKTLFLSYLVKNSIYRVSVICKLAMEWRGWWRWWGEGGGV